MKLCREVSFKFNAFSSAVPWREKPCANEKKSRTPCGGAALKNGLWISGLLTLLLLDVLHDISNFLELLCILVGHFNAKLFLKSHHKLDCVE